jgi:Protein of unknown function (DUF3592)
VPNPLLCAEARARDAAFTQQIRRGEGMIGDEDDAIALREQFSPGQQTRCWVNPAAPENSVLLHGTRAGLYSLWFPLLFVVGGCGMAWRAVRKGEKLPRT